jgi:hypothetical protein
MRIGDEQHRFAFPERRPLGHQREPFTAHFYDGVNQPAARSSVFCIRLIRSASFSDDTRSRFLSTSNGNASGGVRFGIVTITLAPDIR